MTDKEIAELKRLRELATPGPWYLGCENYDEEGSLPEPYFTGEIFGDPDHGDEEVAWGVRENNAAFIVRLINDFPKFIAALEVSEAKAAKLDKMVDWLIGKLEGIFSYKCPPNLSPDLCQLKGQCVKCWREAAERATDQ